MTTSTPLPTGTWTLEPSSTITVTVKKMGFITVTGTLDLVSSTIEIDANNQITNVEVVADAASYNSSNKMRDKEVHGKGFLDAANFPTITFSTGAVQSTDSGYQSSGSLTVKGATSPIDVSISDVTFTDNTGSFTATATVDRKKIGVTKMPTMIVNQNLQLTVSGKAKLA